MGTPHPATVMSWGLTWAVTEHRTAWAADLRSSHSHLASRGGGQGNPRDVGESGQFRATGVEEKSLLPASFLPLFPFLFIALKFH